MPTVAPATFAEDVRHSLQLSPRQLPSRYLYDALGSALFDAICELPWYGITRGELRLLASHREEIFAQVPGLTRIVELGPGDGRKLLTLVEGTSLALSAHLVDVSPAALARAAHTLSEAGHVAVFTHEGSFEEGLDVVAQLPAEGRTLALFLGSNIGNFDPPASLALLRRIRASLVRGDALLVGVDLVKPEHDLLLAYDDPLGVSRAFNLNVLLRVNRELGGTFDLHAFRHQVSWNADHSRMEMFLVSTQPQRVRIDAIDLEFTLGAGEPIWTESSYKYVPAGIVSLVERTGFEAGAQFVAERDRFALMLFEAV